jgi:hypothetical protein
MTAHGGYDKRAAAEFFKKGDTGGGDAINAVNAATAHGHRYGGPFFQLVDVRTGVKGTGNSTFDIRQRRSVKALFYTDHLREKGIVHRPENKNPGFYLLTKAGIEKIPQ